MQKPLQMLVVENFGSCNLRCSYCFPEHMWLRQGHQGAMLESTYRDLVERAFRSTSADAIDIHFAGGEPLLAGQDWLAMAFRVGRDVADTHGKEVTFSMQSNATAITAELAHFLVENRIVVGVSIDGDPEINESTRGFTESTLSGYQNLYQAQGRPPGIIVTVTSCNALRMPEVIEYLDTTLGVAQFRANQMGATASWNIHAAPRAEEWAAARRAIFTEVVRRRGRMMEFNLAQAIREFVETLLNNAPTFQRAGSCCDMRCSAGRELLYFDQKGNAYPCPRANVTPAAQIGHYTDPDFDTLWTQTMQQLDRAMEPPSICQKCPAQFICDYGCHAFNQAEGNFFEVNCDATKEYFEFVRENLQDVARIYYYLGWRDYLKQKDDFAALSQGIDAPSSFVNNLAGQLDQMLNLRLSQPNIQPEILEQRYGWRDELVPVSTVTRPRVSSGKKLGPVAPKGGEERENNREVHLQE